MVSRRIFVVVFWLLVPAALLAGLLIPAENPAAGRKFLYYIFFAAGFFSYPIIRCFESLSGWVESLFGNGSHRSAMATPTHFVCAAALFGVLGIGMLLRGLIVEAEAIGNGGMCISLCFGVLVGVCLYERFFQLRAERNNRGQATNVDN